MKIHKQFYTQPSRGTVFTEPSKTIPDQTMTIREIIQRHSRGLPVDGNPQTPIYQGQTYLGKPIASLELTDREDLLNKLRNELNNFQTKTAKDKAEKDVKKLTDKIRKEIEKEAAEAAKIKAAESAA